jgi:hypothetical protein
MKQVNSDFSKAKVGDPVYSIVYGEGRIEAINQDKFFPLGCRFKDSTQYFRENGQEYVAGLPIIFTHPVKIVHADDEPLVERVMEVSVDEQSWQSRVVFAQKCGYYLAWNMAETIEEAKNITLAVEWQYAREIQPVNPRIAEIESQIQRLKNELETIKEVSK